MRADAAVLSVLFCAVLWLMYWRNRDRVFGRRAEMFRECLSLMHGYRVVQGDSAFPLLTGNYKGHAVRIEAVPDSLGYRKIPSLWLSVSIVRELRLGGAFDFLVRPQNIEFYSPGERLSHSIEVPPSWPVHASARVDCRDWEPPVALLDQHVRALFADPKAKELMVSPRGARIVYQADQGRRDHYLVLRQPRFESLSVAPALLSRLLDLAVAVCDDLARPVQASPFAGAK
jgi:hypothetical protein